MKILVCSRYCAYSCYIHNILRSEWNAPAIDCEGAWKIEAGLLSNEAV